MTAVAVASARCPGCAGHVHVFAHQLLADVPAGAHAAVARALASAEQVAPVAAPAGSPAPADGWRFAVAEGDGAYECPACGRIDWVPLTIDLS